MIVTHNDRKEMEKTKNMLSTALDLQDLEKLKNTSYVLRWLAQK